VVTVRLMSDKELARFDTLARVDRGELAIADAVILLGLSERHVFRLLDRLRVDGVAGLASRRRGRPSNRRLPDELRTAAIALVRARYHDFGPTFAAEKLAELHDIHVSKETLRKLMIEAGLWVDRRARRARVYQPRYRRDCLGELIQIDGCTHWWFEDRGPRTSLLVFIDDATSRLMQLSMVPTESAFAYMQATRAYIEAHGKPVAFYSDKHSVFRVHAASAQRSDGMSQFGRVLDDLNIEIICANSAPAKGRVERVHQTLQDRLVKEFRLAGVDDIVAANAFLPAFMAKHNDRFAVEAFNPKDLHRPLAMHEDLDAALVWREQRTVTAALTLHYNKVVFILEPTDVSRDLARKRVTVCEYPDGRVEIRHDGHALPYRTFDKLRRVNQVAIVDNKHLGAALTAAREMQALRGPGKRNNDAPTRRAQPARMFPEPAADPVLPPARSDDRLLAAFKLAAAIQAGAPSHHPRGRPLRPPPQPQSA